MAFKIGEKILCVKSDVMCRLVKGKVYEVTKVRDSTYYNENDGIEGYFYYGVDNSVKVFRSDKFREI